MLFGKAIVFLWLLKLFDSSLSDNIKIASAVNAVINKLCLSRFNVILPPKSDFVDEFGTQVISNIKLPVYVEQGTKLLENRKRRFFVILLINSSDEFMNFYKQMTAKSFYFHGFFITVFPKGKSTDMEIIFSLAWSKNIYNIIIITQKSRHIEMFTFLPFATPGKCGDLTPVKINSFDENSMKWQRKEFFPRKFKNLRGCSIKCGVYKFEPIINVMTHDNGTAVVTGGLDVEIFNELIQTMNGKVDYTVYPTITGKIYPNLTGTGLLGHAINGDVDATLAAYSLQIDRLSALSETTTYFTDLLIMIMPPPMRLNTLIKFVRPLSEIVWYSIGAVIILGGIMMSLADCIPKRYFKRIVGKKTKRRFMNLLIALIGMTQKTLPEKNFPRFILMQFLIFALIMRSLYLGGLFALLKAELLSKEFTTIKELYDEGFKFYIYDSLAARLNFSEVNSR